MKKHGTVFRFCTVLLIVFLTVFTFGCSVSQLVTALNTVSSVASVAVPLVLAATNLDLATKTAITGYLTAICTAVTQSAQEISSVDADAVKVATITAYFARAIVPTLPSGTPATIVSAIAAVSSAVSNFLAQLTTATSTVSASRAGVKSSIMPNIPKLSGKDKKTLNAAVSTAEASLLLLKGGVN